MNLLNKIEQLGKIGADINTTQAAYIGFTPVISVQDVKPQLQKGWWHLLFWSGNMHTKFAFRIIPWLPSDSWPVYRLNGSYSSSIISASTCAAFPLILYSYMEERDEYTQLIKDDWAEYENAVKPFMQILDCDNVISKFKQFLFEEKVTGIKEQERINNFKRLSLHLDPGNTHTLLRKTIDEINAKKEFIPVIQDMENSDAWTPRLFHMAASRLPLVMPDDVPAATIAMLMRAFDEPLCYDPEYITVSQYSNAAINATTFGADLAGRIVQVPGIKDFLAQIAEIIVEKTASGFTGAEYIEAAAYFDEKENDPKRAWNALVSGAYWSGQNTGQSYLPFLEAAIYLCKKHNWSEAREALEYQLAMLKN